MCGRYTIVADANVLQARFEAQVSNEYRKQYNAAPTQLLPVITSEEPKGLSYFFWGLIPSWSKNKAISAKLINARAESLLQRVSFSTALKSRRCIVPADGFYEWKQVSKRGRIPYRFTLKDERIFSFAGLWDEFDDENNERIHTFTIITTAPNELVRGFHDRMPAILSTEGEKKWLDQHSDEENLLSLLKPFEANAMNAYAVSSKVNNTANNGPELLKPAPPADQFGNLSLFD